MPRSVNDIIADRSIRHAHFLSRLSATEANKIVRFLERDVHPDIVARVQSRLARHRTGNAVSLRSTKRLQELQRDIEQLIREGHQEAYRLTSAALRDAAIVEARSAVRIMDDAARAFGLNFTMPATPTLRAIVGNSMVRGQFLSQDFGAMTARTRTGVVRAINIGLAEGDSIDQITRRLIGTTRNPGGVLAAPKHEARRIVRTAANHVTTQAREITYKENDDIIKGVRWLATLDARTSQICIALDGKIFGVDEGPRPPAHPNCRSTTTPVLRSYRELGLDIPDLPPSTRASMNGQVPATLTYPQWLKSQPIPVQNEVLGVRLAKEWRAGRVSVDKFIDSQNRPLSLAQILKLEGLE